MVVWVKSIFFLLSFDIFILTITYISLIYIIITSIQYIDKKKNDEKKISPFWLLGATVFILLVLRSIDYTTTDFSPRRLRRSHSNIRNNNVSSSTENMTQPNDSIHV